MDLENTTRRLRRRENRMERASYLHIWMSPGHFHVVLNVASCFLNLYIISIKRTHLEIIYLFSVCNEFLSMFFCKSIKTSKIYTIYLLKIIYEVIYDIT